MPTAPSSGTPASKNPKRQAAALVKALLDPSFPLPWIANRYEMIASAEGRLAGLRILWEKTHPGQSAQDADVQVLRLVDEALTARAQERGRYVPPVPQGEAVYRLVDAALNDPEWDHVGALFLLVASRAQRLAAIQQMAQAMAQEDAQTTSGGDGAAADVLAGTFDPTNQELLETVYHHLESGS